MTKRSVAPWLGALVATPALTVSVEPSAAASLPAAAREPVYAGVADRAALQAGLLSMSLDDKLALAGDRLGSDPFALAVGASSKSPWAAASGRTNTNIPECQKTNAIGSATSGAGAGKANAPRTNTDIPECHCPTARQGAGATPHTAPRTNTDIPECRGSGARQGSGATGGAAPRTNTDIPECHAPNGTARGWDLAKCKRT